jgi:hypothetical protein
MVCSLKTTLTYGRIIIFLSLLVQVIDLEVRDAVIYYYYY